MTSVQILQNMTVSISPKDEAVIKLFDAGFTSANEVERAEMIAALIGEVAFAYTNALIESLDDSRLSTIRVMRLLDRIKTVIVDKQIQSTAGGVSPTELKALVRDLMDMYVGDPDYEWGILPSSPCWITPLDTSGYIVGVMVDENDAADAVSLRNRLPGIVDVLKRAIVTIESMSADSLSENDER